MCSRCSNWKLSSKLGNQQERDHFARQPLASHPDQRNTESAPWGQWRVPAWWLPPTRRRCWHCWDPHIGSTRTCHKIGAVVRFKKEGVLCSASRKSMSMLLVGFPDGGKTRTPWFPLPRVPQQKSVHRAFGSILKYPNLMALVGNKESA